MPQERVEDLPAGTHIFLDANIFICAFLGHSNQCRYLLGRCTTEEVLGITSLEVINEATHRMMLAEALGSDKETLRQVVIEGLGPSQAS
jgi:hypothetical protein